MYKEMSTFRNKNSSTIYRVKDSNARADIEELKSDVKTLELAIGSPLVASAKSAMTDKNKIYVYVGSEAGMTNGDWYYWDTSLETPDWASGGTYNETAIETDTTLSVSGNAADSKQVGDVIKDIKGSIDYDEYKMSFDFDLIATSSYPLGWRTGYFDYEDGTAHDSTRYIRTMYADINPLTIKGAYKVYAKAPTGYAISIVVYNDSGEFERSYGYSNSEGSGATSEVTAYLNEGENIGVTVGIFPSNTASDYLTELFVSQIVVDFCVKGIKNQFSDLENALVNTEHLILSDLDPDISPTLTIGKYRNINTNQLITNVMFAYSSGINVASRNIAAATMTDDDYLFAISCYSETTTSSSTLIKGYGWYPANTPVIFPKNTVAIIYQVKKISGAIDGSESDTIKDAFEFFKYDAKAFDSRLSTAESDIDDIEEDVSVLLGVVDPKTDFYVPDIARLLGTTSYPLGWRNGSYDASGAATGSTRYIRTITGGSSEIVAPDNCASVYAKAPDGYYVSISEYDEDGVFIERHGKANNMDSDGTNELTIQGTSGNIYKLTIGQTDVGVDSSTLVTEEFISQITFYFVIAYSKNNIKNVSDVALGKTYNYTIVCAKETNYIDGTPTCVDWYLVVDPEHRFYITKDFYNMKYIFTANYNPFLYKYGVTNDGDIIAVFRTERTTSGSSDGIRQNPFVYLASEKWSTEHVVNFGSSLKPTGWLENCGFCSMPNGDVMFCEYTRPGVQTANCWKVSGDLTDASNWTVVKSFTLSGLLNEGFKHCHSVNYDFYNDVYYLTTGDDDVGAQVWYSKDDGDTWTQAREPSEKYCRVLNMVFTKDYIYWASDTSKVNQHYLFRCARNNGVIDYSTVTELADLYTAGVATYGLVYLEEYNAIVILDKADSVKSSIPFRIYDIDSSTLSTMGTLETADGENRNIGFRTEYSEFRPNGNYVLCGFGKRLGPATYRNFIKGLGNAGDPDGWDENVNNLKIYIYKTNSGYSYRLKTAFNPS